MSADRPDNPRMAENHQRLAREEALRRVRARLAGVDLVEAARRGGLAVVDDGAVDAPLLGRALRVDPRTCDVTAADGRPVSTVEAMLLLRYLLMEGDLVLRGEEVPFRSLPGGAFYHMALARRTTDLIEKAFADDTDRLRRALDRYPWQAVELGDVGARIHALGRLHIVLVFHAADEEFPASAELLYDRAIASVYTADEVSALATHLCLGLIRG